MTHPTEVTIEDWKLSSDERKQIANKNLSLRLSFAVLLKYFNLYGRFPKSRHELHRAIIHQLANQLNLDAATWGDYNWSGRTIKLHRAEIRKLFGFRTATVNDGEKLVAWLCTECLGQTRRHEHIEAMAYDRLQTLRIEPPTPERFDRLIRSALHRSDQKLCHTVYNRLSTETCQRVEHLLDSIKADTDESESSVDRTVLQGLRSDSGPANLDSLLREIDKLNQLRALQLPQHLFKGISSKIVTAYQERAVVEQPHELRRHPVELRITLLCAYSYHRIAELTDTLVDLLITLIQRIGARAERKVEKELLADFKRVSGKTGLLFQLAEISLDQPEGVVQDVIYPVVNASVLKAIVKEWKSSGPLYRGRVQLKIRNSYRTHYRRMLSPLLDVLTFCSNNERHRPIMDAIELLERYMDRRHQYYPSHEIVPIEGVVPNDWFNLVIESTSKNESKINRLNYEVSVLQTLQKNLRCKEIWVKGADRFGNPDHDLPQDFDERRIHYYEELELPLSADTFIAKLKQELATELSELDRSMPTNSDVRILKTNDGLIKLSPLPPQQEPSNLLALKADVAQCWPMINLLDVLKETDLRVGFTDAFRSPTPREHLDRTTLQHRILLCLYATGTNAGLKRIAAGQENASYRDLQYIQQRFIHKDHLRFAIAEVVNKTLQARLPHIWGEVTSACASDARYLGAWDQNLMTEWRARNGGPVVGIYWHVERHASCIYSQLKTCSSSEVAAMIQGVLHHCTEMEVNRHYVDSHGQSTIGFAFCRLLGFDLLPRLKAIHNKRLYRPEAGRPDDYPNLQPVLSKPINWKLVKQQYDEFIKFATALRTGTSDAETILRRFTRYNLKHPTFKGLSELGKACRTIFMCRYLRLPALRREIDGGLNIIENWNSANDFILFGKSSEIASNRRKNQELTILALHLLQNSLVYINTLMLQQVLANQAWTNRLTEEDARGLTPLFYNHINPYGNFLLDLNTRLGIEDYVPEFVT